MNKKKAVMILFLCILLLLCGGCQKQTEGAVTVDVETDFEVETVQEDNIEEETVLQEEKYIEAYDSLIMEEGVKRAALIYLDEDDIPELLVLKNGEYRLYSCDGTQITVIEMPNAGIEADAYGPKCAFFDMIEDTVYKVIETNSTTDVAYVAKLEEKRVIARTDLTHGGRKCYEIMQYDACGCLVDFLGLYAFYEGRSYTAEDKFKYRRQEITMEEFEERRSSIQRIPSE